MKTTSSRIAVGLALFGAAGLALAFPPGGDGGAHLSPEERLAEVDTDGDGLLSREEFVAARSDHFAVADRDGDGYISALDVPEHLRDRPMAQRHLDKLLNQFDSDADGLVSQLEFQSGPTPLFDRADANGDGVLELSELEQMRPPRRGGHHRGGARDADPTEG